MTAKEKLRERVDALSEEEAERMLAWVDDPVVVAFREAPIDDEPWTEEDEAAMAEVEADRAAGVPTIPHDEIKSELGIE